jgi:tRNA1Val (adenine37-N6)-methyltransferase
MGNSSFSFMHFTIQQDRCAMKVGTDGVLLGAWAGVEGVSTALDIGTGTGLIALMIAQRASEAVITALEIDEKAAAQAAENFASSKFRDRLSVKHIDIQDEAAESSYDLLVCNPPFFPAGTPSPDAKRHIARHDESLDLYTLFTEANKRMKETSRLALVWPSEREEEMLEAALFHELFISRICRVRPNPSKEIKRILVEFQRSAPDAIEEKELVIELGERHVYSEAFRELTKEFYPVQKGDT